MMMIGRKGKRPVVPRRGQTKPPFVVPADSGSKKGSSRKKKAKGANPAKQPAPPSVKDECEVVLDDATESRLIREFLYDAAGRKFNFKAFVPDVCPPLPPGVLDEAFFPPYPLDGAQEIVSDDSDFEVEYVFY